MMINKIFFDANIILDLIDSDRGNIEDARALVYKALTKGITLYTSCDILSNVYYVARRKIKKALLVEEMLRLIEIFEIIPIDRFAAENALLENQKNISLDFEDLLQRECAERAQCEMIVSNDKKFVSGTIKVFSTKKALEYL